MVFGLVVSRSMCQSYVAQFNLKGNASSGGVSKVALPALCLDFYCYPPGFLDSLINRNW